MLSLSFKVLAIIYFYLLGVAPTWSRQARSSEWIAAINDGF